MGIVLHECIADWGWHHTCVSKHSRSCYTGKHLESFGGRGRSLCMESARTAFGLFSSPRGEYTEKVVL